MSLQGSDVVDVVVVRQQSPAEPFAAEMSLEMFFKVFVGVVCEVDGTAELVVGYNRHRCPIASEIHIVDVDVGTATFHMLQIP